MVAITALAILLPRPILELLKPVAIPLLRGRARRLYSNFISKNDLVFDVGAHIGDMTIIFLELGAKVICIDPQPSCISALKKRFGNNLSVRIVGKGVGENTGTLALSICSSSPSISTFSTKWKTGRFCDQQWNQSVEVPVTTLDSIVEQFGTPAFCKIDVEGFEFQALKGLHSKIHYLSFEFTKEFIGDARLCANHLSSLGKASFNLSLYSEFKLESGAWLSMEELFRRLDAIPDKNLYGDIYVRLE